jgi:hypothetical protein
LAEPSRPAILVVAGRAKRFWGLDILQVEQPEEPLYDHNFTIDVVKRESLSRDVPVR